jgi:hypothetical protein
MNKQKPCNTEARNMLAFALKARSDKRYKVVGKRTMTRKQKNQFIKSYKNACKRRRSYKRS